MSNTQLAIPLDSNCSSVRDQLTRIASRAAGPSTAAPLASSRAVLRYHRQFGQSVAFSAKEITNYLNPPLLKSPSILPS